MIALCVQIQCQKHILYTLLYAVILGFMLSDDVYDKFLKSKDILGLTDLEFNNIILSVSKMSNSSLKNQ
jgi:hypothetical protein